MSTLACVLDTVARATSFTNETEARLVALVREHGRRPVYEGLLERIDTTPANRRTLSAYYELLGQRYARAMAGRYDIETPILYATLATQRCKRMLADEIKHARFELRRAS